MVHPFPASQEIVDNVVSCLPSGDLAISSCLSVSRVFSRAARKHHTLYRNVVLRSEEDITDLLAMIRPGTESRLLPHIENITISVGQQKSPDTQANVAAIISEIVNVKNVDLRFAVLHPTHVLHPTQASFAHLRMLVLQYTGVVNGSNITDYLVHAPRLESLSLHGVEYGSLSRHSYALPMTLRELHITLQPSDDYDYDPQRDGLLTWMVRHTEKVPDIIVITLCEIQEELIAEVVLILSYLSPVLRKVALGIREGDHRAHDDILKYSLSNELPLVSFRGADYETLAKAEELYQIGTAS